MKKIMTVALVGFLAFTGCINESNSPLNDVVRFSASDFQGEVANTSAARNSVPASNMKIAIRKVANGKNTYRLALRIDSILITEGSNSKMIPLPDNAKIIADLSVPPNKDDPSETVTLIFEKSTLTFKRTNQNGFDVFVSDPFVTDFDFDYELVTIEYAIEVPNLVITLAESHYLILPNGKAVIQNPEVEKVNKQGKWTHASGKVFAKTMVVTIANDPAQEVAKLVFVPDVVKIPTGDPNNPIKYIELPSVDLAKTHFNQNNGVARFSSNKWEDTYNDTTPWEWSSSGVIYLVDGNGVRKWLQGKAQELAN